MPDEARVFIWPTEYLKRKLPEIVSLKREVDFTMNLSKMQELSSVVSRSYYVFFSYLRSRLNSNIDEIQAYRIDGNTRLYAIKRETEGEKKIIVSNQEIISAPLQQLTELLVPMEVLEGEDGFSVHIDEL